MRSGQQAVRGLKMRSGADPTGILSASKLSLTVGVLW